MSKEPNIPDAYLGDGVYASFDGYHIWLDLRNQDPSIRIALEPGVFAALLAYHERVYNIETGDDPADDE